MLRRVKQMN
uniref:Uncharacterized protein n=1 Tax=Rhizophora mucronata TaxID=61149 RepID=A0A2P2NXZ0_RHIMU